MNRPSNPCPECGVELDYLCRGNSETSEIVGVTCPGCGWTAVQTGEGE